LIIILEITLAQNFISNVKLMHVTRGIVFKENYSSVIIFEITFDAEF